MALTAAESSLLEAIRRDDETQIRQAFRLGANINAKNEAEHNKTFLHEAVMLGKPVMVALLLELGARTDVFNDLDQTPMHTAASIGHVYIGQLLIDNGADVNATTARHLGETPLHYAGFYGKDEFAKLLLENGANSKAISKRNQTPSQRAKDNHQSNTARLIVNYHNELKQKRALQLATQTQLLITQLDGAHTVDSGPPIDTSPTTSASTSAPMSYNASPITPLTASQIALFQAVMNTSPGNEEIVRAALAAFGDALVANINAKDESGHTALHIAAAHGTPRVVELLLDAGADICARNIGDVTPLHSAACAGKVDNGRILIRRGAPLEAVTTNQLAETPLHYAAYYGKDAFVRLLIESGANYKALSNQEQTPAQRANAGGQAETARLISNYHNEFKQRLRTEHTMQIQLMTRLLAERHRGVDVTMSAGASSSRPSVASSSSHAVSDTVVTGSPPPETEVSITSTPSMLLTSPS